MLHARLPLSTAKDFMSLRKPALTLPISSTIKLDSDLKNGRSATVNVDISNDSPEAIEASRVATPLASV